MITINELKSWAKDHPNKLEGAKQIRIESRGLTISIVGGAKGLYGDFENDFELAIWENKNKQWRTKFFYPEATDDVLPYLNEDEVVKIVNLVVGKADFQVL